MLNMTLNLILSLVAGALVMMIHELAKYYFSLTLLHPIHRKRKDMRVNAIKFIDPIGLIVFAFSGFGWQKPGEYNPTKFREKERGLIMLAFVGICANVLVILSMIPLFFSVRYIHGLLGNILAIFVYKMIRFSFALIVVNLLPMPPFDMAKIIYALNPSFYFKMIQNERMIQAVFILMIAFGLLGLVVEAMFYPIQQFII